MRHIYLKKNQEIGSGAFGRVYRISPRRVVKVFYGDDFKSSLQEAKLEIKGSKQFKHALPVLELIKATYSYETRDWIRDKRGDHWTPWRRVRKTRAAVIKRYIPYGVTDKEIDKLYSKYYQGPWDRHPDNYRKDSNGVIYLIDTSTRHGWDSQ